MKEKILACSLHILFWLLSSWMIISGFSIETHEIEVIDGETRERVIRSTTAMVKLTLAIGISVILFYLNIGNIRRLQKGYSRIWVVFNSVLLLVTGFLIYSILEKHAGRAPTTPLPDILVWGTFLFYFAVSITYGTLKIWVLAEDQRKKLILEKKESELSLLKAQLQPHFLFNVLNNLLSMIDQEKDPLLAQSFHRLSDLLRYVVYETAENKVPVSKEISFIRDFAELHLLRFETEEVDFDLNISGHFDQQPVEPGIFIPFVENAFKYGAEPEKSTFIHINFELTNPSLIRFNIQNTLLPGMQKNIDHGMGINSTKQRLELVYPGKHTLQISENETFIVDLEIQTG